MDALTHFNALEETLLDPCPQAEAFLHPVLLGDRHGASAGHMK